MVCVHNLVRLYCVALLLHTDLAEHILLELAARTNGSHDSGGTQELQEGVSLWDEGMWSGEEMKTIKESVVTLMDAAGEVVPEADAASKLLSELLQAFVVGTKRRKVWKQRVKLPPKPSELGPIADMQFLSTARRARLEMKQDKNHRAAPALANALPDRRDDDDDESDDDDDDPDEPSPLLASAPNYKRIWSLIDAAGCETEECKFVGVRLLAMQANEQLNALTVYEKRAIRAASKNCSTTVNQSKPSSEE